MKYCFILKFILYIHLKHLHFHTRVLKIKSALITVICGRAHIHIKQAHFSQPPLLFPFCQLCFDNIQDTICLALKYECTCTECTQVGQRKI